MSATWTTYGRQQLLAAVLNNDIWVLPSWWIALCLSAPRANDDGAMLVEPATNTGYLRTSVPMGSTAWLSTSPEEYTQAAPFDFAALRADAGLCQGWALVDAATIGTGNVWVIGSMVDPFTLDNGDSYQFNNAVLGLYD